MNRIAKLLVIILNGACFTQAAFAHAYLDHSEPKVGATVASTPTEVKVWFDDDVQADKSDIQVFDSTGKEVDKKDSHGDGKDKALLTVSVPSLTPGKYRVVWHAVCLDSHHTTSQFQFTIEPAKGN